MRAFASQMAAVVRRHDMQLPSDAHRRRFCRRCGGSGGEQLSYGRSVFHVLVAGDVEVVATIGTSELLPDWSGVLCLSSPRPCEARLHGEDVCRRLAWWPSTYRGGRGGGRGGAGRQEDEDENEDLMFPHYAEESFTIHFVEGGRMQPLVVSVEVRGANGASTGHSMLVDTGAVPSVVSSRFVAAVGLAVGPSRTKSISGVGASKTAVLGEVAFDVELGGVSFGIVALVAETALFDFLLGTRGMRDGSVGTVQINVGAKGGRVRVGDGRWVEARSSRRRCATSNSASCKVVTYRGDDALAFARTARSVAARRRR
jgi:hypothetical protein